MADIIDYTEIVADLRSNFEAGILSSLDARLNQLHQIELLLKDNKDEIIAALYEDLHKSQYEAVMGEMLIGFKEIRETINKLEEWMKPEKVSGGLLNAMNALEIQKDPLGVVLVMGAWNYPLILAIQPLIGAIAAGNCVVLKPSEVAIHTAELLAKLVPKYINPDCVKVICGGVAETTALLRCRFDHILYTGGSAVGKIIMKAASEHLTPVTLELGGKNPTIVDSTCDFDLIGQRIAWGKFFNNGQTCIAVDYVMCVGGCQDKLLAAVKKAIVKFFGEDPESSQSYGRIINSRHFKRICGMIDEEKVVYGNIRKEDDLYISPTLLTDVTSTDRVMEGEIFGPVMAMMNVATVEDAIRYIRSREKPLAIYVFSKNKSVAELVKKQTSSGSLLINDTLMQFGAPLPFGGVGHSGMGAYHGKHSFDCFSHKKAVMSSPQSMEMLNDLRYPPYDRPNSAKNLSNLEWIAIPSLKRKYSLSTMFMVFLIVLVFSVCFPYFRKHFL